MSAELEAAFDAASKRMKAGTPTGNGGAGNEKRYAKAYQALVKAGLRMQLPAKLRG